MSGARECDSGPRMIENQIGHADEHVFFDIGIKLAVHFLENISRRGISDCLTAQDASANRHDQRSGNALARNIRDSDSEPFVIDFNVIKIIATDLTCRHIYPANLKSIYIRCLCGKQNSLNIARNFEVMIESLLFVGLGINDRVVERKGGLLGDRFENKEVVL